MALDTVSPKLPLKIGPNGTESYSQAEINSLVRQNLKHILLTIPGERIMVPDFGVGLPLYLHEFATRDLSFEVKQKISQQIKLFMPYIRSHKITLKYGEDQSDNLYVSIIYKTTFSGQSDRLDIRI